MRGTVISGCICTIYAGLAGTAAFGSPATNNGAGSFFAVSGIVSLCIAAAMFFMALTTLFTARATDRIIDQFRGGESLADWSFAPSEWDAFLALEEIRRIKGRRWIILSTIVGPIAAVLAITGWLLALDIWVRTVIMILVAGMSAAAFWLIWQLFLVADHRHFAMMRRNPRVLIRRSAIYCGGVLTLWDVSMTVLRGIRMIAGSPMMLEVTTGASTMVSAVGTVANVTSMLTGSSAGGATDMTAQVLVPVPFGREDEAAQVAKTLLQPPGAPT